VLITNKSAQEAEKFRHDNERKAKIDIDKLTNKHDNELNAFKLKMKLAFDEYKKNRALEYDM
jgi:hypothetical protein